MSKPKTSKKRAATAEPSEKRATIEPPSGQSVASPFDNALAQFSRAAQLIKLSPDQVAIIREPRRIVEVKLPVRMDDGSIRTFTEASQPTWRTGDRVRLQGDRLTAEG